MRAVVVAVLVSSLMCPGCLIGAVAFTRHERLGATEVGSRVASRPADVFGQDCYVDKQVRIRDEARVDSWWGVGGGVDALLFGLGAGAPDVDWWVPALAIDGALAFAYFAIRNRKETTDTRWEETLETAPCKH